MRSPHFLLLHPPLRIHRDALPTAGLLSEHHRQHQPQRQHANLLLSAARRHLPSSRLLRPGAPPLPADAAKLHPPFSRQGPARLSPAPPPSARPPGGVQPVRARECSVLLYQAAAAQQKGAPLHLPRLQQGVHQELASQGAPADAHGRKAVQVHVGGLQLEICPLGRAHTAHAKAHRHQAVQVPPLRAGVCPIGSPGTPPQAPPVTVPRGSFPSRPSADSLRDNCTPKPLHRPVKSLFSVKLLTISVPSVFLFRCMYIYVWFAQVTYQLSILLKSLGVSSLYKLAAIPFIGQLIFSLYQGPCSLLSLSLSIVLLYL